MKFICAAVQKYFQFLHPNHWDINFQKCEEGCAQNLPTHVFLVISR